ncbi:MAG: hypothetical protein IPN34_05230 [Planctomycetes bacterium]|nr:hypothetical protein [Planctomycetota bacterium]
MKPQDLIDMKEFARLTGKSKGAIYQWKRASSFPFRIYKTREGLDSVSRAAVLDWMEDNGMKVRRSMSRTSMSAPASGQKRVVVAARRGVVEAAEKKRARPAEEVEEELAVEAPKIALPMSEDFNIQFWSKVVDAMELRGMLLSLSYENGKAILHLHDTGE